MTCRRRGVATAISTMFGDPASISTATSSSAIALIGGVGRAVKIIAVGTPMTMAIAGTTAATAVGIAGAAGTTTTADTMTRITTTTMMITTIIMTTITTENV